MNRITAPFDYLEKIPGKDLRPQMVAAFNALFDVPEPALEAISWIVQTLHIASLLVDDVEDSATLRRGQPVAHAVYGVPQTINSSNYMLFKALEETNKLGTEATMLFTEEMLNLHRGQGLDLYWRDSHICPTEEEYTDMVHHKTGGLYRMAVRLMQSQSANKHPELVELASTLGVLYQIQDDYLNLQSSKYKDNKGFCEDITEGKFSLPIIHSVRADPNNTQLLSILRQRTTDVTLKEYALRCMEETGSFAYTRSLIKKYEQQARVQAQAVNHPKNAVLLALIDKLVLVSTEDKS